MDTLIRLRDAATVRTDPDGATRLLCPSSGQSLGVLSPAQRTALDALAKADCAEVELLTESAADGQAITEIGRVHGLLTALRAGNWLAATLAHDGRHLLTVHPTWGRPADSPRSADDLLRDVLAGSRRGEHVPGPVVLSRFAQIRRDQDRLLLETPLAGVAVEMHDPAVLAVVAALARPQTAPTVPGVAEPVAATLLDLLVACRLAAAPDSAEETGFDLAQWSPHELWFHTRSRQGRHELPWGATFWARDRGFDPLPARRPSATGQPLPRPDLDAVAARDPSLTRALEDRRSTRAHDDTHPLTVDQLGEFLYRVARTRRTWTQDSTELTDRPYPSGGALHELELYPVVVNVTGLAPGLYRYDGHAHALVPVSTPTAASERLGGRAASAATMSGRPQVLIVVTARFGRLMWKYRSMAYALILKHVGVLYSAMYLVATAMGLAACALGGGDSELFARASGLAVTSESSVGEFVLGSAPSTPDRTASNQEED